MTAFNTEPKMAELWFGCFEYYPCIQKWQIIHSINAYVWCWRKACGSLDEIPSVTMGTCKRKFLMNSNMTLAVLNLHQQTQRCNKILRSIQQGQRSISVTP